MIIKMCGITHPEDAELAGYLGADYIGMIFAKQSRRCVSHHEAQEIVHATKNLNIKVVGVFVEQEASEIISICKQLEISSVQLHGSAAKTALEFLPAHYEVIYAQSVCSPKQIFEKVPRADWTLYDNSVAGSGDSFEWESFVPPAHESWFLAGGLNANNVKEAIKKFRPKGVDVSSGIEKKGSVRKDPYLMENFIVRAK